MIPACRSRLFDLVAILSCRSMSCRKYQPILYFDIYVADKVLEGRIEKEGKLVSLRLQLQLTQLAWASLY